MVDGRNSGGISGLRLRTFENKAELGTSWTTVFLHPSCVASWMFDEYMTVKKKSNRNDKRMKIFLLDCFVDKTGPVLRLAILDVVVIKQRT
jgi:hypothetical protein